MFSKSSSTLTILLLSRASNTVSLLLWMYFLLLFTELDVHPFQLISWITCSKDLSHPPWLIHGVYIGFKVISIERHCRRLGACSPFPWSRNELGNLFGKWKGSHWTPYRVCPSSTAAAAAAKSLQSCPTLCDPRDGSPPGSPVPGILQARILEWVAISFSSHESEKWKWRRSVLSDS